MYFKKNFHCHQFSNNSDDQLPNAYESRVTHTDIHRNIKTRNDRQAKNATISDEGKEVVSKTFRKGFDASSITSKLNLKAVSVSRNSLTRRISTNNSSSETSNVDKLGTAVESDASTNSSVASGFTLNMFQTKGPFAIKTLLKQPEQKRCEEPKYTQSKTINLTQTREKNHSQTLVFPDNPDTNNPINKSKCRNITLSKETPQNHPNLNVYPGICGIPRLHDFADPLPSPASAVASLTRHLESDLNRLELKDWAVQGQYVVKPQVTIK